MTRRNSRTPAQIAEIGEEIRSSIYSYCKLIDFEPHFQQRWLFDAVQAGERRIAVRSGQGPGKTAATSVLVPWRTLKYPQSHGGVTAPTMRQCKLWMAEMRRNNEGKDPILDGLFRFGQTKAVLNNDNLWTIDTYTSSDPKKVQGIHNRKLMFVLEEASGIPREIAETIIATVSNKDYLIIQIGNPNTRDCDFFDCFTRYRHMWTVMQWDAEETANKRPDIVNPERNELLAHKYGRNSDVYRVRVKGDFPRADPDSIMAMEDVEACTKVSIHSAAIMNSKKTFGIDFARKGSDESVLVQRAGNSVVHWEFFTHTEPMMVVERAFALQKKWKWHDGDVLYIPDASGMGQGLLHQFYKAGKRVYEFHNGGTAQNSSQYGNKITEAWFYLKALVENRRVHIPDDSLLIQQLTSRKYTIDDKTGKIKIEQKDRYITRTDLQSPDRADALVMAFYDHAMNPVKIGRMGTGKRVGTSLDK